jgi:hypothetical protein
MPYMQFVTTSKYNRFIEFECIRSASGGDPDQALAMLRVLADRRVEPDSALTAQEKVGSALGARDKQNGEFSNPLTYLAHYQVEGLWYSHLRKAYMKSFRRS